MSSIVSMDNNSSSGGGGGTVPGRGRGRPRASYAQTGELDLSLIREYRSRPSLYDRNSKRFHDKMFTAQQWQMISHKLGYDVSLLKDRMLQLRNRYNIERRRLDQWREENNDDNIMSPWPLFDILSFLSDHIRSRRSYKHLERKDYNSDENFELMDEDESNAMGTDVDNDGLNERETTELEEKQSNHGNENEKQNQGAVMATDVKVELETPTTDDEFDGNNEDAEQQLPVVTVLKPSATKQPPIITYSRLNHKDRAGAAEDGVKPRLPPSITLRRIDGANGGKYVQTMSSQQQQQQQQQHKSIKSPSTANITNNNNSPTSAIPPVNKRTIGTRAATMLQNGTASSMHAPTIEVDDEAHQLTENDQTSSALPPPAKRLRLAATSSSAPTTKATPSATVATAAKSSAPSVTAVNTSAAKFHAFGDFVGSALTDLPAKKALRLVEKFTSELVQALIQQNNDQNVVDNNDGTKLTNGGG